MLIRRCKIIFITALLSSLLITGCSSTGVKNVSVKIPVVKEIKLDNGLEVLLLEDKSLPYVTFMMMVNTGSVDDPQGQFGLASMVASLLDQGTNVRSAEQIADSVAQKGARLDISASSEFSVVTASGLSFHQDSLLKDFAEVITQPSFSESEVNRLRTKRLSQLRQVADDPSTLASIAFSQFMFSSHPYAHNVYGSIQDLRKLQRKNIIKFYLQHYRPNNSRLAVVGNFDVNEMKSKVEESFKGWEKRDPPKREWPAVPQQTQRNFLLVERSDLKQTQLRFGQMGIPRKDPDFLKLRVANTILGGGFSSRLLQEVREKRGLTYSISSQVDTLTQTGVFAVSTFTRHEKIKETIDTTIQVLTEFRDKGVTEEEVADAKALLIGTFPRIIETPEALVSNLLMLRHYGIPDSYLKTYLSEVRSISTREVNEVIKKHYKPELLQVIIYAPKSQGLTSLKPLGDIQVKGYQSFL